MDRWTDGPVDPGPGDSQVAFEKGVRNKPSVWPYGWFRMVYVDGIALPTLSRFFWGHLNRHRWNPVKDVELFQHDW